MVEYVKVSTLLNKLRLFGWLFGLYGISTFLGYLMPIQFLNK